jgi:hypothetical protein
VENDYEEISSSLLFGTTNIPFGLFIIYMRLQRRQAARRRIWIQVKYPSCIRIRMLTSLAYCSEEDKYILNAMDSMS